jgi:ankyrin repeat protein
MSYVDPDNNSNENEGSEGSTSRSDASGLETGSDDGYDESDEDGEGESDDGGGEDQDITGIDTEMDDEDSIMDDEDSIMDDDEEMSTLWSACKEGDDHTVNELLVAGGLDIDKEFNGFTPLRTAICMGHENIVVMLLNGGANSTLILDSEGWTYIMKAVVGSQPKILKRLLEHNSTLVNAKQADDISALDYAVSRNNIDMAEMLIQHGADVNLQYGRNGSTPLFSATREDHSGMVELLLKHGAVFRHEDKYGDTAFNNAVWKENIQSVQMFIDAGIDINHQNKKGVTVTHMVAKWNLFVMARFLSTKGVCFDIESGSGRTPCDTAAFYRRTGVLGIFKAEIARRVKCEAFCMGQLERVGDNSHVRLLDPGVVRMIVDYM